MLKTNIQGSVQLWPCGLASFWPCGTAQSVWDISLFFSLFCEGCVDYFVSNAAVVSVVDVKSKSVVKSGHFSLYIYLLRSFKMTARTKSGVDESLCRLTYFTKGKSDTVLPWSNNFWEGEHLDFSVVTNTASVVVLTTIFKNTNMQKPVVMSQGLVWLLHCSHQTHVYTHSLFSSWVPTYLIFTSIFIPGELAEVQAA